MGLASATLRRAIVAKLNVKRIFKQVWRSEIAPK
jgi:hypothetical protein